MSTACLIGNGMSIAYNENLTVQRLTDDLLQLFREGGAMDPGRALAAFAESQSRIEGNQFEALLGPLSSTAEALGHLPGMAALAQAAGAAEVVTALNTASVFLTDIHRVGLAITLGHVAGRSLGGRYEEIVVRTAAELINLGPASELSVATLNYDGLLHAGMMDAGRDEWGTTVFPIIDLAAGYGEQTCNVALGHRLVGHPLRGQDNLLNERAALLQLHGSLGWLAEPDHPNSVWRFELQELRDASYWRHLRDGTTSWLPVVVLTDRKDRAVSNWPFSLAYDIFQRRLISSDRWLVVGYGLGDVPVNGLFATALHERMRLRLPTPEMLVIDETDDLEGLQLRASVALGIPPHYVVPCGRGLPDAFASDEWMRWKAGAHDEPTR